jgi:uncharacterized membrane protein YsdA (DUF1294 family)/cold shock CspA family protein
MQSGTIKNWNDKKGFGFITPKSGGKDIFTHISDFSKKHQTPTEGIEVNYFLSTDPKGRKCAVEVRPIKGHKKNTPAKKQRIVSTAILCCFSGILFYLFESKLLPIELIGLYVVMSILAIIMYAKDKNAAEWGTWRTPESTLHAIALVGGWPGAGIAQSFLRHKSKKISFRVTYWVTVIANCCVLWWLVTPGGNLWLNKIVNNIKFG